MVMIYLVAVWLKIVQSPCLELKYIKSGNIKFIGKYSTRVNHMINQEYLYRYVFPHEAVINKKYEFEIDFYSFLRGFAINPIYNTVKPHNLTLKWIISIK